MKALQYTAIAIIVIVLCGVFYYAGKNDGEIEVSKLKEMLSEVFDTEKEHLTTKEVVRRIENLKVMLDEKILEFRKLKKEKDELAKKLAGRENYIKEIAKKMSYINFSNFVARKELASVPDKTLKDITRKIYQLIVKGDFEKALKLLIAILDLLVKANEDYITVIR